MRTNERPIEWMEDKPVIKKPDVIRLTQGGIKHAWMRNAQGAQEFIEVVWWEPPSKRAWAYHTIQSTLECRHGGKIHWVNNTPFCWACGKRVI